MSENRGTPKREILADMGISDRLLKYWVSWYKLPVNRRGRGSNYPKESVDALRLIKALSDSGFYTMKYISEILAARRGNPSKKLEELHRLCNQNLNGVAASSGSSTVRPVRRQQKSGGDIGADLL